jgi:hypothetical protein
MHERPSKIAVAQEVHYQVERLRMQNGRSLKIFSGGSGPGKNEYSRSDDRADAERR